MVTPEELEADSSEPRRPRGPKELVRRSMITGTAIILPLAVTLLILGFVLNFISTRLDPITGAIQSSPFVAQSTEELLIEGVTVLTFLAVVFCLGFVAEFSSRGDRVGRSFDDVMEAIPGVGSVYTSFNEMSEILLDSDTDSFQEVKLVEYPGDGSYTVAFKTAETPGVIEDGTGHDDMVTLFMPMAPNPVMGGFVIHVSKDRVFDVDMTVEQGIRSIVTSGVAIGEDDAELRGLSASEMRELGQIERVDQQVSPDDESPDVRRGDPKVPDDRIEEYVDNVAPEHSDTAQKIADREREDGDPAATGPTPAERASRDADDRGTTETTPAEASGRDEQTREPTSGTPAEQAGRADDA
ncbi:DUF502 domain-containing protein [Halorarius litoreus]|uniref:DUF502 domain-containing protein n=1 Tax=Halorarius litoreus TaxID=2962676 RepID=UPI0020CDC49E|nr:DUF502 domain-containing protein [Halorarius litoreus]